MKYAKIVSDNRRHHERLRRRIEAMPRKLTCQECGGAGGHVLDDGRPFEQCGWCEGLGYVTPWARAAWLRARRER